jgi:hypothetical protein
MRGGLAAVVLAAVCGCGGEEKAGQSTGGAKQEATVTGQVTIKGKPATKAKVTFAPLDSRGMPAGSNVAEVKDGSYSVTTQSGDNDVTITGTGNAEVDATYNKKTVQLKPGANTENFELPLKP